MHWFFLCSFLLALCAIFFVKRNTNNVCKTFGDYYTDRDNNENCSYNGDHELRVQDIIKRHGYPFEEHHVGTDDGYVLTLFRIPYSKNSMWKMIGEPVLLQHGITINSGSFVNIGNKSLAFILSDAGYDVWLGNFRGTIYSRAHRSLAEYEDEFWDFSFHELGIYDLPVQIDLVKDVTKKKLTYVGYSMGTTAGYVYASSFPEIARENVKMFVSLAPLAYMDDLGLLQYVSYIWPILKVPIQYMANGKFSSRPPMPISLFQFLCLPLPIQMEFCQLTDMIGFGFDYEQNDPETLPVTLQHNRDSISVKMVSHYIQLILSGNFEQFDYGNEENQKKYGSPNAPVYNLSNIEVPNYFIRGANDLVSTKENVDKLYEALPKNSRHGNVYVVKHDKFNHIDFFTAKDIVPLLNSVIVKVISDCPK